MTSWLFLNFEFPCIFSIVKNPYIGFTFLLKHHCFKNMFILWRQLQTFPLKFCYVKKFSVWFAKIVSLAFLHGLLFFSSFLILHKSQIFEYFLHPMFKLIAELVKQPFKKVHKIELQQAQIKINKKQTFN